MCYSIASVLCFIFFGPKAYRILDPWPGIKLAIPPLEGKILTTGPPWKFLETHIFESNTYGWHFPGLKNKGKRVSKRESLWTPTFKDWEEKDKLAMEAKQERKEKNSEDEERAHPNEDVVGRQCQVLTTSSSRRTENLICIMDSD